MDSNQSYVRTINSILKPSSENFATALDLFAGAGGLGLGFEAAGFQTIGFEKDKDSAQTYVLNLNTVCHQETLSEHTIYPSTDIVIGGPPCQPFSVGGKQSGLKDSRDGFPAFIAAIQQVKPKLFLFENVRGMMYRNQWYLDEIVQALRQLGYLVDYQLFNTAHYGVPQKRQRVIVVGHRGGFEFPKASRMMTTAGDAIHDLLQSLPPSPRFLTPSMDTYVAKYEKASKCKQPRDLHLNRPSRTVTCRNLAGATGDMMRVRLDDGRRRRLTVREGARLQSFPDWFKFIGTETSQFNQVGNAVPPIFAHALAQSVRQYIENSRHYLSLDAIHQQNARLQSSYQLQLF